MSSFFTLPASQRKRKRIEGASTRDSRAKPGAARPPPKKRREARDESISGSESEQEQNEESSHTLSGESSEEESDEDAAGKRTRLAERYLENTRQQILAEGFDAKDIDNEILAQRMGERLKEDTAESKGKLYRWIADDYDYAGAKHTQAKADQDVVTGVAVCYPYMYTVSKKDMSLIKWDLSAGDVDQIRKPKRMAYTRGNGKRKADINFDNHTGPILCIAASDDGKFVATGGQDRKLIVWNAENLKPLKVFTQHRDSVTSVCFRRGTNQLFSSSKDRTIKTWSLNELAYVETLYGHQDEVLDVGALNQEKCVTVGARDRTARYWRIVEESQLVFRGGGSGQSASRKYRTEGNFVPEQKSYNEGSMDRVAMVDEETFVTGSDNGTLSLWNIQKKKAVFTYPLAHGLQPAQKLEEVSAETDPNPEAIADPQPRWITALACLPFSNIIVSGSWDGEVRVWKISEDKRRIEPAGTLGQPSSTAVVLTNGDAEAHGVIGDGTPSSEGQDLGPFRGFVNDLAVFEKGEKGKDGLGVAAAMGKEHRLGGWFKVPGKNVGIVFDLPKR